MAAPQPGGPLTAMDDRVINIFLEDGQKREYLVNSKHTVERIKAVVMKDHDLTFGSAIGATDSFANPIYDGGGAGGGGGAAGGGVAGDYRLSVVTFYSDRGEFTIRDLEREKDEILLYILFPSENPQRPAARGGRPRPRRSTPASLAAAEREAAANVRYELLFHRAGATVDLSERKFVGMFVTQSLHQAKADLINHLTVRVANPDMAGNLRKYSEKRAKWQKKYFMLKQDILWYAKAQQCSSPRLHAVSWLLPLLTARRRRRMPAVPLCLAAACLCRGQKVLRFAGGPNQPQEHLTCRRGPHR